jgi:hypothetical protein
VCFQEGSDRGLADGKLVLFSRIGIGIDGQKQLPKLLNEVRSDPPELDVRVKPIEYAVLRQIRVADHQAMFRCVSSDPMFQSYNQTWVPGKGRFDLCTRSSYTAQILQSRVPSICRGVALLLHALRKQPTQ